MHIIGIIIALATAVFWVGRAARSAKDIAEMASTLKNMQKPNIFKNRNRPQNISQIEEPMDAAIVLMICVARLSSFGQMDQDQISPAAGSKITDLLTQYMQISKPEAQEILEQMLEATRTLAKPETALSSMTNFMSKQISHKDAQDLSVMLNAVSKMDGPSNEKQENFISRFGGIMGLTS